MKLIATSIRRPVTVFIVAVAALVFGVVAFQDLATDLLPDVTYPSLTVRTEWDGAAPQEIESLLTRPVENAVGVVENLLQVTSSSRSGLSEVTLEFAWGTAMDFAALDVRERLDLLRLPIDSSPPVLLRYDPALDPVMRLGLTGDGDLLRLRQLAEERVQRPLERLEGVAAAVVQGGLEEEIQVEVDTRRLASLGLDMATLSQRLAQENVNLTGGRLQDSQAELLVRTINEIRRPEDLEGLVIDTSRGAQLRLSEVATVRRGHREREIITRIGGAESVEISIYKSGGSNTVKVSKTVQDALDEIRLRLEKIAPELEVTVITDQASYISRAVDEVLQTAWMGGLLAVLVLYLFLRSFKTTSIIGVAIPISVVATFFCMYVSDISLNIMSLGGLTLGIGLLVDNAIVVLESIQRRLDEGLEPPEAAEKGTREVATAIVASTMTSICVFAPIIFVEGVAAQFFSDQALTVTYSLLASLVVALTVVPMLASRCRPALEEGGGRLFRGSAAVVRTLGRFVARLMQPVWWLVEVPARLFAQGYGILASAYARLLAGSLRRPLVPLLVAVALSIGSWTLYGDLGQELVPELVQGELYLDVELPPGTHLDITARRLATLEDAAQALPQVETAYAILGSTGQQGGVAGENREHRARLTLLLHPPISRQQEEMVMASLRQTLAADEDLEGRFSRPSYFSFKTPIELEVRGNNLILLRRLSDRLADGLSQIDGLSDVESSAEGGTPELQIRFDRDRLASYGLTLQQVASVIRSKVQGDIATEIQRQDRTIDIRVRAAEPYRDSAADLRQLIVHRQGAVNVPLSAVAEVETAEGPVEIRRIDGERSAVLSANLVGRDLASASGAITELVEGLDLPQGFDWQLGGQGKEMQTSFDSLRLALGLAIFLVYLVMASQFESLLHPLVILGSVPLSLIGVLAALALFEVRLSVVVLIGAVLLAGIVVNNAIILVDTTNRLRREEGFPKIQALQRAGELRLRPILMTTATTVLGLLPMALGLGEGSELRAPMALTVIGGLLSSTLLTLVVIPVVYSVLDRGK